MLKHDKMQSSSDKIDEKNKMPTDVVVVLEKKKIPLYQGKNGSPVSN